jgi:hypothetical protein
VSRVAGAIADAAIPVPGEKSGPQIAADLAIAAVMIG